MGEEKAAGVRFGKLSTDQLAVNERVGEKSRA